MAKLRHAARIRDLMPRWVSDHVVEIVTWLVHLRRLPLPKNLRVKVGD